MSISAIEFGTLVGSFPCISMLFTSFLLSQIEISAQLEAFFQNFAAGLIIAAVASELFPLLHQNATETQSIIGISIGFVFSLAIIHGIERVIQFFEEDGDGGDEELEKRSFGDIENDSFNSYKAIPETTDNASGEDGIIMRVNKKYESWDENPIQLSLEALLQPEHRNHIHEHLEELYTSITSMQRQSDLLLQARDFTNKEVEEMAENIDKEIHRVQYKLDHARRLLQGSENKLSGLAESATWVTEEKKLAMRSRLQILKSAVEHLLEHIKDDNINLDVIKEMHEHMDEMDNHISQFHSTVEHSFSRWRRNRQLIIPPEGSVVPVSLLSPVIIDAFVDGFLIGVSCSLNPKAGYILAFANVFEMGILGIAFTIRVLKCTGSSEVIRFISIISPPVFMLAASAIGAAVGSSVQTLPIVFVAVVSFGIVALLFLVCNELLIEAKRAQGEEECWWIGAMIFVGVYVVLLMDYLI